MAGHVSDAHQDAHLHGEHAAHIVPVRIYILVFLALLFGTWLTVYAAGQDFGAFNTVVALTIAITKATLVVLFFMHLKYSGRLVQVVMLAAIGWLILLMTILFDYYSPTTDGHLPERPAIVRE